MSQGALRREMGLGGAVVTGLGAILGTGAFVSIGIASGQWGDAVIYAIPAAGVVALCSGLSSAHLAGRFPVAGGTYEYGYQALGPYWGFAAGWLFILAKTASAASAALGIALYLGLPGARWMAIAVTVALTALVAGGLRLTTVVNAVLLAATLAGLLTFIVSALDTPVLGTMPPIGGDAGDLLPAAAFLFVAYTGFGRVATLGEEVVAPRRTIPRATVLTLADRGLALSRRGAWRARRLRSTLGYDLRRGTDPRRPGRTPVLNSGRSSGGHRHGRCPSQPRARPVPGMARHGKAG